VVDQVLQIDTPENVVFGYEVAGLGTRFLAALIDTLILAAAYGLVLLGGIITAAQVANLAEVAASLVLALVGLAAFTLLWGYYIFFETIWNGQSPGKRVLNIRVIRMDGTPIGMAEAAVRNLVRIVDFLPVSYGVGVITMFANGRSRRLGDLAAGTVVVFGQEEVTLESLTPAPSSGIRRIEPPDTSLPVERLSEDDVVMAEMYLARRRDLVNREDVLSSVIEKITTAMGVEPPATTEEREQFLVKVLKARRASRV
jgi:uncharacterized RDD family membrane protein YckC